MRKKNIVNRKRLCFLEEMRNLVPNSESRFAGRLEIFEGSLSGEYKCEDCEIVFEEKVAMCEMSFSRK